MRKQFSGRSQCHDLSTGICGMDFPSCARTLQLSFLACMAYQKSLWTGRMARRISVHGTLVANASANAELKKHLVITDAKSLYDVMKQGAGVRSKEPRVTLMAAELRQGISALGSSNEMDTTQLDAVWSFDKGRTQGQPTAFEDSHVQWQLPTLAWMAVGSGEVAIEKWGTTSPATQRDEAQHLKAWGAVKLSAGSPFLQTPKRCLASASAKER